VRALDREDVTEVSSPAVAARDLSRSGCGESREDEER